MSLKFVIICATIAITTVVVSYITNLRYYRMNSGKDQ